MGPVEDIHPVSHELDPPQPIRWVWPNVIPRGSVTVLDGDPGTAKSLMTIDWAARLSRGAPWPDESDGNAPGTAILFCGEDLRDRTVRPRLLTKGADLDRVFVVGTPDDPNGTPSLPADLPWLDRLFARVQPQMVVFDPLALFLSSAGDPRTALMGLVRLASVYGPAIVLVRHLTKRRGVQAMHRGVGTVSIVAAARTGFLAARDPSDPSRFVLTPTKSNLGPLPPALAYRVGGFRDEPSIQWLGPVAVTADAVALGRALVPERPGEVHAAQWLVEQLDGVDRLAAELLEQAKAAGISERTLQRAKSALKIQSRLTWETGRRSWLWSLPKPTPKELPPEESHESLAGLLAEHGMTATDLARATGFTEALVDDLLSGKQKLTLSQVQVIAEAFGIPGAAVVPRTFNGRGP